MYVCIIHDTFYFVNNSNCYYFYFVYFKSTLKVDLVWELADFFNGLMVIPNAMALLALSGVVAGISKKYGKK